MSLACLPAGPPLGPPPLEAPPGDARTHLLPGPKKCPFALSESGNGFAERSRNQFLIKTSPPKRGRVLFKCGENIFHVLGLPPGGSPLGTPPPLEVPPGDARTHLLPGPKNAPLLCQNPETVLQNALEIHI